MPFKKSRTKVLPDDIHFWRGRNWPILRTIIKKPGGAHRKREAIGRVVNIFKKRKAEGRLDESKIRNAATAIEKMISLMTDEVIDRLDERGIQHGTYNQEYLNCLRHFWRIIPDELRHEIVHQIKAAENKR